MEPLETVLAGHPFLAGMEPRHLRVLAGCASQARFEPGVYIFREGEPAEHFYLLREGKVALQLFSPQHKPLIIETLGAGDVLGWSWLVPPHHWRFHAQAVEATNTIVFNGLCLRAKCEEDYQLGYELLKRFARVITRRLEAARYQLLDVYASR
jgi:CRP-like cAMP-binding protein